MAKVIGTNVIEFDAATQTEGLGSGGQFEHPLFVEKLILVTGGTGGTIEIHDASGGTSITGPVVMAANDREVIPLGTFVKGLYVTTLVASGEVRAILGNPRSR
jgi:hypothetical protein